MKASYGGYTQTVDDILHDHEADLWLEQLHHRTGNVYMRTDARACAKVRYL